MALTILEIHQDKLSYLSRTKTLRQVARESNIPVRYLRDVQAGVARIPTLEMGKYNAYYRRTTYGNLRDTGMNTSQATRFSGLSAQRTINTEKRVSGIIEYLTGGVLAGQKRKLEARGLTFDIEFEYDSARAAIWEGLRTSRKIIEQWEGY